ncbi:uncharacterized protein LOC143272446 isoform X1 [Peromyscus maniculatus bairdii]|uniref:uncharacterized protein LOC143272446 isoform X1 n=1 Tax=Peromyscus maniculatus bairdii TaxID=230844 RepID=UPI003FCF1D59
MYSQASLNLETDSLAQLPEGGMTALGGACDPCQVKSPCCSGHHNARESRRPADDPGGLSSRGGEIGYTQHCNPLAQSSDTAWHFQFIPPPEDDSTELRLMCCLSVATVLTFLTADIPTAEDCSNRMLQIKQLEAEMHALETLKLEVHRGSCAWDFTASEA